MKFPFHQKKKKTSFISQTLSFSLWKRKERENSNTDLRRRAEARWSAISSPPLLRPITGICLTLCLFPEKKKVNLSIMEITQQTCPNNYWYSLSFSSLVERLRSMAQRESSSLIWGLRFECFWNWNCVAILWNLKYELDL